MKPVHAENNLSWLATSTPLIALVRIKNKVYLWCFNFIFYVTGEKKQTNKKTLTLYSPMSYEKNAAKYNRFQQWEIKMNNIF